MFFLYIAYLIFQLKTHSYLFDDDAEVNKKRDTKASASARSQPL